MLRLDNYSRGPILRLKINVTVSFNELRDGCMPMMGRDECMHSSAED
jgi:hypothetical protein